MTDRIYFKDIITGKNGVSQERITFLECTIAKTSVQGILVEVHGECDRFYPHSSYFYHQKDCKAKKMLF